MKGEIRRMSIPVILLNTMKTTEFSQQPLRGFPPQAEIAVIPPAVPRRPMHTRRIVYESFARDDGLFDLEGWIVDTKAYRYYEPARGTREPGDIVHEMKVRLTIDAELVVRDLHVSVSEAPYPICPETQERFRALIGLGLARGWRRSVDEKMGGTHGCTHVRELLYQLPTVAFQSLGKWSLHAAEGLEDVAARLTVEPRFIDGCHAWAADGPIVAILFPDEAVARRNTAKT